MVGRPRSKGCFNCRRRKKGCDLARPSCGQCLASNLSCEGYKTNLDIVAFDPSAPKQQATNSVMRTTPSPSNYNIDPVLFASLENMNRAAFEAKYIGLFWDLYLPPAPPTFFEDGWTGVVERKYTSDDGLRYALLALTLSRVGRRGGDQDLVQDGIKYYGKSLHEISKTIKSGRNAYSDEVLAACLLLISYEMLCGSVSPGSNWQAHAQGMGDLIRHRGPRAFISGDSRKLFVYARFQLIAAAITSRKPSFISTADWMTVPWSTTPKILIDGLVDLFAQIPRLLERFDILRSSTSPSSPPDWQSLINICWLLDKGLRFWHDQFQALPDAQKLDLGPGIPRCSSDAPKLLVLYNTVCIYLYTTMRLACEAVGTSLLSLPPHTIPLQYAISISSVAPVFFNPIEGESSPQMFAFAMGTALQYLAASGLLDSEYGRTMTQFFGDGGIGEQLGLYLRTMQRDPKGMNIQSVTQDKPDAIVEVAEQWWAGGRGSIGLHGLDGINCNAWMRLPVGRTLPSGEHLESMS